MAARRPRPQPLPAPRTATVAGHLGEFLQGRIGPDGPVALITVPCPPLTVRCIWQPGRGFGFWQGARPVLSRRQVAGLLAVQGGAPRGRVRLRVGMPPGGGAGASTACLLSVLRCISGDALPPQVEAALCLDQEGATDPLMFPEADRLLWAPRAGRVLERLPQPPAFEIVAGFAGPGRRTCPGDLRFADITDLVAEWRPGPGRDCAAALATESARRNHALRGGPDPAPVLDLGRDLGALGLVAAHTGTALGLLFAPGTVPEGAMDALRSAGLGKVLRFRTGGAG